MKNVLIVLLFTCMTIAAYADCEYNGKTYETLDTVVRVSPAFYKLNHADRARYGMDGYVVRFVCSPVVKIEDFDTDNWDSSSIKATLDTWVVHHDQFEYTGVDIQYPGNKIRVEGH